MRYIRVPVLQVLALKTDDRECTCSLSSLSTSNIAPGSSSTMYGAFGIEHMQQGRLPFVQVHLQVLYQSKYT